MAAVHPPGLAIVRDTFPPNYRATVNSIYSFADFMGAGIASFSLLLIDQVGWRNDFKISGYAGILIGILLIALIKDPERG